MRLTTQIPDARIRICILKTPDNGELELTQYIQPEGKRIDLRVCNLGVFHLAFEVDDIMEMYRKLSAQGVEFYHEPLTNESGPFKGRIGCYLRGPDGVTLELLQFPHNQ
jgi:catechol 2,3-dioxygenase-like lactoylglutathione lyase family enzyme